VTRSLTVRIRSDYAPQARAERLIAAGRLVLAVSCLIAIYLEPSTPAKFQKATYTLLVIYTVYATVVAIAAWRGLVPSNRYRLFSHSLDLVLFSVFVYLTEGPASPFFLYFVFSLFCATLRFSWRGILATAIAAIAIYGALALLASWQDPSFEPSRTLIRIAYLAVIAALLVYLGVYQHRLRIELASLAAWPRELATRPEDALNVTLAHAAAVMSVPRVLLTWEEAEEPWVYVADSRTQPTVIERFAPQLFSSAATFAGHGALLTRAGTDSMLVYDPDSSSVSEVAGDILGPAFRERYGIHDAIVVALRSETMTGQFIVPSPDAVTTDDLALAHVAGRLAIATLEQFLFVQQVRQTASAEERLRISRDLHDGIVQSLAGVGLRLQALRQRLGADLDVSEQLRAMQAVLEDDQRELRTIVRELRPHDPRDGASTVAQELQRMSERYPLEWGLAVELEAAPLMVSPRIAHEVCRIVNESLSNAARHGGATSASVTVRRHGADVEISVSDNGRGFPFEGALDLASLEIAGHGPRTLKERVRHAGGSMTVRSSPRGASITITLPTEEAVA
jgi:signal transduction histidine kinase